MACNRCGHKTAKQGRPTHCVRTHTHRGKPSHNKVTSTKFPARPISVYRNTTASATRSWSPLMVPSANPQLVTLCWSHLQTRSWSPFAGPFCHTTRTLIQPIRRYACRQPKENNSTSYNERKRTQQQTNIAASAAPCGRGASCDTQYRPCTCADY